jgi:hypothetical protein
LRLAGDRADLVKARPVDQPVDALADRQLAGIVLALDLVGAAQLARQPLALALFVEFRLPGHVVSTRPMRPARLLSSSRYPTTRTKGLSGLRWSNR